MIYIVRHGSTRLNSANRMRGWLNVPLDAKGRREATDLAPDVKKLNIDLIVASDLDRTQETAHIISRKTGIPFTAVSKAFRPWHIGVYSGKDADSVSKVLQDLSEKYPDKKINGGESFNQFRNRLINGIKRMMTRYPHKKVAIVTHHSADNMYEAWKAKGFPSDNSVDVKVFNRKGIDPGEITK